jgi:hypothetical protein
MIDRRLKRKQTRHEVERAAKEDQEDNAMELELVSFCSMSVAAFHAKHGARDATQLGVRALKNIGKEHALAMIRHGSWLLNAGRMHFGYLRDKATKEPTSIASVVEHGKES